MWTKQVVWCAQVGILSMAVLFAMVGCGESNSDICGSDTDCKGDRICINGECISEGDGTETSGDGNTATSSNTATSNATTTNIPSGPTVMCPFDGSAALAVFDEPFSDGAIDRIPLEFYAEGALRRANGLDCTPAMNGDTPGTRTDCFQTYTCDACTLIVGNRALEDKLDWYLVPETIRSGLCPELDAFYDVCSPNCEGRQCGDDGCGGSCGTCSANQNCATATGECWDPEAACNTCISNCSDLPSFPNCCQCGDGCACANECANRCP